MANEKDKNKPHKSSESLEDKYEGATWMNSLEAATYLRFLHKDGTPDPNRVRALVHQGRLPFYKPFGRLIFKKQELDDLVQKTRTGGYKIGY